ncbi:hypothetical protein CFAM422_004803 [Trichoderma lentiforme]|uniref:Uncharacterized protein n=1 Tax=Trichoderma lentiforme TaxID=1567552 RepID=A0A9P4XJB8_9HYPO|nr:hypothetical protein CFAM422_004803 [Trichoderma lentiforme]
MWCLRKLLFVAAVFSGRTLGDGTVTPTDSIERPTSFLDITYLSPTPSSHHALSPPRPAAYAPLPGFIPKPQPVNDEFSSAPRLTTFITHTIPRETTTDSISSLAVKATSTSSDSPAVKPSNSPSPPSSTQPEWSRAQIIGWGVGGSCGLLLVLVLVGHLIDSINDGTSCFDCSNCSDCCDCWKKKPRQQKSPGTEAQRETTLIELDAANQTIGELSAPETTPFYSPPPPLVPGARELDGSSTLSPQSLPSTSQQPAGISTSVDSPDSSSPPSYEEVERETNGRRAVFSWAAPESAYRPEKRDS